MSIDTPAAGAALLQRHQTLSVVRMRRLKIVLYGLGVLCAAPFVLPVFTAGRDVPLYECDPSESYARSFHRSYEECAASYRRRARSEARLKGALGSILPLLLMVAVPLLARANRRNQDRLRRALEAPQDILWVYVQERRMSGAALYRFVILHLRDGTQVQLAVPFHEDQAALLTLRSLAPHALVGFGDAQRQAYEAKKAA